MLRIGIVGAGAMGAGIAQLALEAGHDVTLNDPLDGATDGARQRIRAGLGRRAARLGLDADAIDDWVDGRLGRLQVIDTLPGIGAVSDVVIEAAAEDLTVKRAIFAGLDDAAAPDAILATNTSALSVAAIAAATTRPGRLIGLHFFNPPAVMALVEVIVTPAADPAVVDRGETLVRSWGKTTVRCADSAGFIVNRVNRPFTIEALRVLERGEATVETIDAALRAAGFPMGPFELMDFVGIDVNLAAARSVWEGLGRPERLRPSPIQERLATAGHFGRKTGRGFYTYVDGRRASVAAPIGSPPPAPTANGLDDDAIVRRILAAIDTEAALAVDAGIATPADIALALQLGAGHPTR